MMAYKSNFRTKIFFSKYINFIRKQTYFLFITCSVMYLNKNQCENLLLLPRIIFILEQTCNEKNVKILISTINDKKYQISMHYSFLHFVSLCILLSFEMIFIIFKHIIRKHIIFRKTLKHFHVYFTFCKFAKTWIVIFTFLCFVKCIFKRPSFARKLIRWIYLHVCVILVIQTASWNFLFLKSINKACKMETDVQSDRIIKRRNTHTLLSSDLSQKIQK